MLMHVSSLLILSFHLLTWLNISLHDDQILIKEVGMMENKGEIAMEEVVETIYIIRSACNSNIEVMNAMNTIIDLL